MLFLDKETRERLWTRVTRALEDYAEEVEKGRVTPQLEPGRIRDLLEPFDFSKPHDPLAAVDFIVEGLHEYQTHTPHPRYYGLFNPAPTTMGVAADSLVAGFNPQLAAWSHSPFAIEMERHLVASFAERFGYRPEQAEGTFATGGAEANHTAVLTALTRAFPEYLRHGVKSLRAQPVLYISSEGHDSLAKAARMCGLGTEAVREIAVDSSLRMSTDLLRQQIQEDLEEGFAPFLIVATAGTTGAGTIDPLPELVEIAAGEGIWLHVDAAWGGAAVLVPELGAALEGIEQSDSITFDAHKWLSVPMGAGLYLTRHPQILERTFKVAADYMPKEAADLDVTDPYAVTMQWSRRFIGLKVFLSLAVAGWQGYEEAIRHQTAMGNELRQELGSHGWRVVNETPLPVVCFVDRTRPNGDSPEFLDQISRTIVDAGEAWISTARLGAHGTALRACITNFRTASEDIAALVSALNRARSSLPSPTASES